MRKRNQAIPVNTFGGEGIAIERLAFTDLPDLSEWNQPERHDRHSFFLVETGTVCIEIDFQTYEIVGPSIIYMHPDQVHLIKSFDNLTVTSWAITNENLYPTYLAELQEITPTAPLKLDAFTFELLSEVAAICIKLARKPAQKDCVNALISLVIAQYTVPGTPGSRFEHTAKIFRQSLEQHYLALKRPADYADLLNISVAYLNECVKTATGFSVSHHIQERVILEAKRLLYHSKQSVKEIAAALGYDDYPYFCRLFKKVTGITPLSFRNRDWSNTYY